ncbi:energy-coupling factor ABC transporter ATP-binding protein [Alkalihalobacillus sp. CinArs1]|uniref:energy-coupling factor ABC transporter ATP-binding protein n=1 Tax=Alkalihalobacillus sp. CinArs1 TaxID=2995314 RepID=UPI0022DE010E|nr:energy-coupling factor ABC transporter ATP-binding protein [Alkalihalobacillus sp. CinArs1]
MDITIKDLEHLYSKGTPFERIALKDVDLSIKQGTFLSIIGHTGSGKSTLIQHLNGLLKPTSGSIQIGDFHIKSGEKEKRLKDLRKHVGVVFQYPEHQLFEETIEKDIIFGPMNFGVAEDEAKKRAAHLIDLVGLDQSFLQRSPFDLSGGQMRRVAIAGVLAMKPSILILDEPTAGLDPRGRKEIMELFYRLHNEENLTTILVTHSMEDAARYSDQIVIMEKGTVALQGTPVEVFSDADALTALSLDVPETMQFIHRLETRFGTSLPKSVFTLEETVEAAVSLLRKEERS